ncbi:MAG: hypothetical protein ABGZ17_11475, partial [Planctomycetaceae bacterium]
MRTADPGRHRFVNPADSALSLARPQSAGTDHSDIERQVMIREEVRRNAAGIPVRVLGKTGLEVSLLGFGGGHYCRPHLTESQSIDLVRMAVEQGVTFMDNAWEYWDGESERR